MLKRILLIIFFFCAAAVFSQLRTFDEVFPSISRDIRSSALTSSGYVNSSRKESGFSIQQATRLDPSIVHNVKKIDPGYIVESIIVIPANRSVSLLDIYNAIGNIRGLQGRLYSSATRNQDIPLFENATRITSERQTSAIPDPPRSSVLPQSETIYIRLRDANFGNTFYRGEITPVQSAGRVYGLRCTLSNFRGMYAAPIPVPVIGAGKFIAQLYIEPISEGTLIYSLAGADIANIFASQIHVDSAISKRLAVITGWAADEIKKN